MSFVKIEDGDTICALSTASGVGGIAVLRVSGPRALAFCRKLCSFLPVEADSHRVYYGYLKSLVEQDQIDEVLVTYFAEGRSFTGEETVEISCHGGEVTTSLILKELVKVGCRMARRGEFTYRAFMNGRLDLVQAESVLGLIESQSKQSAKMALRQLQGHLSQDFGVIEDQLVWMLAHLEASIDFSTEDLEVVSSDELIQRSRSLSGHLERLIDSYNRGRLIKDGFFVALIGSPNAGKSSLLNAILNEEKAIVTPIAGTTRDLIEGKVLIKGFPVTFIDTAGLREASDEVEKIGISRSHKAMNEADLTLYISDLNSPNWEEELTGFLANRNRDSLFVIFNKIDLDSEGDLNARSRQLLENMGFALNRAFWVSATRRVGLEAIEETLAKLVDRVNSETSSVVTQARHLELLQKIYRCLTTSVELMSKETSPEFIAFELQEAVHAIHEILGKEFDEQVIDRIFKEFCLGK